MRKFVLAAIGSKYIHCNLAICSLKAYAEANGISDCMETAEYTVNQNREDILADLAARRPTAVGFSCYIWNIGLVKGLAADLRQVCPETDQWLGGPEASYDAKSLLRQLPFVRGVMCGEGEEAFLRLMEWYERTDGKAPEELAAVPGLAWRLGGEVRENVPGPALELSRLPFVYRHISKEDCHKILYYESSRGCPFSCSYCLSSIDKGLRLRDMGQVKEDLAFFLKQKVPQVKFVDRTFNCVHRHAMGIWEFLEQNDNGVTNFHFEIAADLLTQEELGLLGRLRPGQVQLEIGVQSVNPETLREIRRTTDLERLAQNVETLGRAKNVHRHLDLIAGLPYEDYESFGRSFDWAYRLRPEQLQLGFLKVLKGSHMYETAGEYGMAFSCEPPYEVLQTRWLSYEELCRLKRMEKVLETYYNSGQFTHTMERLCGFCDSPFALYEELADFLKEQGLFERQLSRRERFDVLWEFISSRQWPDSSFYGVAWRELLVYDYYLRENAKTRPSFAPRPQEDWPSITAWYAKYGAECPRLAAYRGYGYRQLLHMTHAEVFPRGFSQNGQKVLVLFDYNARDPLTNNAAAWEAEEWTNDNE